MTDSIVELIWRRKIAPSARAGVVCIHDTAKRCSRVTRRHGKAFRFALSKPQTAVVQRRVIEILRYIAFSFGELSPLETLSRSRFGQRSPVARSQ